MTGKAADTIAGDSCGADKMKIIGTSGRAGALALPRQARTDLAMPGQHRTMLKRCFGDLIVTASI